ncbi:MMPL family transporter [Pseudomonas sp. JQ170]|uniref:efflux RND transporter permease subunit n=1 Tax=unclassified Pseudomonas TaxID=196821 RepID=UPI002650E71C|nr:MULTISPECIES: efflux RND transporter permease subunit [unclassified Pseudomonas]MDN7139879.1 MMPL family transporter [Pseudomonas sp. JQ170]WRO73667.1 efflux RND transporter permease subunit [Pseudomonas sp. 170C]
MSKQEHFARQDDRLGRQDFSRGLVGRVSYWIFHQRKPLLALFILITLGLGYSASHLKVEAGFFKMIPLHHPYMQTFLEYQKDFGGANKVLVAVKNNQGEVFTPQAMAALRKVSDEVFFINGVERSSVTSLFTSNVRYTEVVEDGFTGGNLVDSSYAGTPEQIAQVRERTLKSDWVGRIVSNDLSAAMVVANLQETDPTTGERLDLQSVAKKLEQIRQQNQSDDISIHIIGFAKSIGDIAEGASGVLVFFIIAFVITAALLYWYCGSLMLTGWALICAVVPVIWLLGLLPLVKLTLDPMSILVPFLIFSIGVSHAVQMTNAWKLETLNGADGVTASRNCFQKLFIPGAVALLANALGFMVIALVDIEMVRELAITATLGVSVMIVTNKMLLPILLSFMRLSAADAQKLRGKETLGAGLWERLGVLATRRGALGVLLCAGLLLVGGLYEARNLHVGDTGAGVPELRADSRYNQDVAVITGDFAIGVDLLQVVARAKSNEETPCVKREVLDPIGELELYLRQDDGVSSVRSLAGFVGNITQAYAETDLKWRVLPEPTAQIAQGVGFATRVGTEYMNSACNAIPVSIYTRDHQADTITTLMDKIKAFKAAYDSDQVSFELASGNVGVMAATNEVVHAGDRLVNSALFASVTLLCLWMFRSLRITLCVILPLALVTVLCNALMAVLGIGVKVNTLPVVALGVGVGVDYGIYLFERIKHEMHEGGADLREAFVEALKQRGTASVFTAVTMTLSIATWAFSSLKFQADMGILLAFMFLVNLLGAILLLPALAAWLLRAPATRQR